MWKDLQPLDLVNIPRGVRVALAEPVADVEESWKLSPAGPPWSDPARALISLLGVLYLCVVTLWFQVPGDSVGWIWVCPWQWPGSLGGNQPVPCSVLLPAGMNFASLSFLLSGVGALPGGRAGSRVWRGCRGYRVAEGWVIRIGSFAFSRALVALSIQCGLSNFFQLLHDQVA